MGEMALSNFTTQLGKLVSPIKISILPNSTSIFGRPKTVNQQYCDRLKQLVSHSPRKYGYGFRHWTAQWLAKHLAKELGITVSSCHINRLLKQMGLSTRPKDNIDKISEITHNSRIKIQDLSQGSLYTQGKPAYAAIL